MKGGYQERVPTRIGGRFFPSNAQCAKFYGVGPSVIHRALDVALPEAYIARVLISHSLEGERGQEALDLASELLNHVVQPNPLDGVAGPIAKEHGVTIGDIKSSARAHRIVEARHDFVAAATEKNYSMRQIANYLRRDHTTVQHARDKRLRQKEE